MAFVLVEETTCFHVCVLWHASVMARARILLILTRTMRVFLIFVTSAQLINREFLAFPSGNFFKNRLVS